MFAFLFDAYLQKIWISIWICWLSLVCAFWATCAREMEKTVPAARLPPKSACWVTTCQMNIFTFLHVSRRDFQFEPNDNERYNLDMRLNLRIVDAMCMPYPNRIPFIFVSTIQHLCNAKNWTRPIDGERERERGRNSRLFNAFAIRLNSCLRFFSPLLLHALLFCMPALPISLSRSLSLRHSFSVFLSNPLLLQLDVRAQ